MSRKAFWDTNLLVYRIEQSPVFREPLEALVAWQKEEGIETVTSAYSLAEIMVQPLSVGQHKIASRYRELICQMGALSFGPEAATVFAQIRAQYEEVSPPAAIQLACASVHGVEFFFTGDRRLKWVSVENVGTITTLVDWYESYKGTQ